MARSVHWSDYAKLDRKPTLSVEFPFHCVGYRHSCLIYLTKNSADNVTVPHLSTLRMETLYLNAEPTCPGNFEEWHFPPVFPHWRHFGPFYSLYSSIYDFVRYFFPPCPPVGGKFLLLLSHATAGLGCNRFISVKFGARGAKAWHLMLLCVQ